MTRPAASHVGPEMWRILQATRQALANVAEGNDSESSDDRSAGNVQHADRSLVFVGLSGGPDSLALAAALAALAPELGIRAGAVIVDHGLQDGSAQVAATAAEQARAMALDPVIIKRVDASTRGDGPEAAARSARYAAFDAVVADTSARALVIAHTLDDVAESVLLGLARGSGPKALAAMRAERGYLVRPLLNVRRADTHAACVELGLSPWHDPQNNDETMLRAVVRHRVLPQLRDVFGDAVDENLSRTAELLRDDVDALDAMAHAYVEQFARPESPSTATEHPSQATDGSVGSASVALASQPHDVVWTLAIADIEHFHRAFRTRMYRMLAHRVGQKWPTLHQTREVDRLVTEWHGQGLIAVSGATVGRKQGSLRFAPIQSTL